MSRTPLLLVLAVTFAPSLECGPGDARFTTKLASDFAPAHHTISVFGVYEDGRMSPDAWTLIGPRISLSLGATRCDAAYEDTLVSRNEALASAIDDYARATGPTDDLLTQLAPAARGDLVLVLTLAGKLPVRKAGPFAADAPSAPTTMGGRGGGMGGGGSMPAAGRMRGPSGPSGGGDTNEIDMSASLYSVAQAHSVGLVAMEYTGTSVNDAVAKFAAKLAEAFPGMTCAGWTWDGKVDAERIRKNIEQ
jgi:hypothetical protein